MIKACNFYRFIYRIGRVMCDTGWAHHAGVCYRLVIMTTIVNARNAELNCTVHDATMAKISNSTIAEYITRFLITQLSPENNSVFLGTVYESRK